MKISRLLTVAIVGLGLGVAATAFAKNDEGKHGRGKDKHAQSQAQPPAKKARARFRADDRHVVQAFYAQHPGALPPGLAKKGKVPPGHAKRLHRVAVAQIVTPEIEVNLLPLPPALEVQLPPPPHTVIRRILGRDLVMIDKHTHKVLDVLRDALP